MSKTVNIKKLSNQEQINKEKAKETKDVSKCFTQVDVFLNVST